MLEGVALEKMITDQLVIKFPASYVTRRFISVFTKALHVTLP
jgi:hypothetical protein